MRYTYLIDCGELLTESRVLATDEKALDYGKLMNNGCNVTYIDSKGNNIGELEI